VSLVTHAILFTLAYTVNIGSGWLWETPMLKAQPGSEASEVVEIYGRPLILPPEVVEKILQQGPTREPPKADLIGERSSTAQGEPNPDPRGSSQNPKSSGSGDLSSLGPSSAGANQPAANRTGPPAAGRTGANHDQRPVVESTTSSPTVAFKPPTTSGREVREGGQLPDAGGQSDIAQLNLPKRETPGGVNNQDSAIVPRGPISVNVRGVGAVEEYRVQLQRAIQQRWQIPPEANLLERTVSLTVEFTIAQDGRLVSVRLQNSTGVRALDRAAQRAIELAAPFRPLPRIFPGPAQVFTDTFVYYPPAGG
jgi:TonB family protein